MTDTLRWLHWTPSCSSTTESATKPTELTEPTPEGVFVSSVGSINHKNQKMDLPWPGYNGGKQFFCEHCGTRFDTSCGHAKHLADGCKVRC
jgi:hypothetical protein